MEKTIENGRIVYRIISSDPQLKEILKGTPGPYAGIPPWGEHTQLGGWGIRHGFVTSKSRYALARSIAVHGTQPAGSFQEKQNWVQEVLRQSRL